jgi:hypothetical protein
MTRKTIWCCGCDSDVSARLTDGGEIYPHRRDLTHLPFWRCDVCGNHVGCHHKTQNRTRPLGAIPSDEIRQARMKIHQVLDPLWKSGRLRRKKVYSRLTEELGRPYHTGDLRTLDEADAIYRAVQAIEQEISVGPG